MAEEFEKPLDDDEYEEPLDDDDRPAKSRRPRRESRKERRGEYDRLLKKQRGMATPHRGVLILVLGIASLFTCWTLLGSLVLGIVTFNMAGNDLNEMLAGRMDASGRGLTHAGRILSLVGIGLAVLMYACVCGLRIVGGR